MWLSCVFIFVVLRGVFCLLFGVFVVVVWGFFVCVVGFLFGCFFNTTIGEEFQLLNHIINRNASSRHQN